MALFLLSETGLGCAYRSGK